MMRQRIIQFAHWYDRYLAPVAFVAGFTLDSLTLTRADLFLDNLILIAHLANAALGIALVNAYEAGRLRGEMAERAAWLFPLMIQFSFGALFSGFVVLYFRSGSFAASWFFLALLATLLIGNEFFRQRYRRIAFHLAVYFVALYAYLILAVPVLFNRIGAQMFVLSGVSALAVVALFAIGLNVIAPQAMRENRRRLALGVGVIFAAFNLLYFTNAIPPIPLAAKRIGIYHAVSATNGGYRTTYEPAARYEFLRGESETFHWKPGEPVYAGSAVFAPTKINTRIIHRWLRYNQEGRRWVETDRMPFAITGGRDDGYRGYTFKQGIRPGFWRVEVRTERNQLLGRTTFEIIEAGEPPALEAGML